MHQVVDVPSGHSSSHGDAFLVGLLLEEADREAFQPHQIIGGKAVTDSTFILSKRHIQARLEAGCTDFLSKPAGSLHLY